MNQNEGFQEYFQRCKSSEHFGVRSPLDFLGLLYGFSRFLVQFAKKASHNVENSPISGRRKKPESCHVSGCHGFLGPEASCIVKGRRGSAKSPWRFAGAFDYLRCACSLRIAVRDAQSSIKSLILHYPCKPPCLYNSLSFHTVDPF